MRLKSYVKNHPQYKKLILHQTGNGVYLFWLFDTADGSDGYNSWFQTIEDAKYQGLTDCQVEDKDWIEIPDPLPGALHTWEVPTVAIRYKNRNVSFLPYEVAQQKDLIPKETPVEIPDDKKLLKEIRILLQANQPIQAIQLYVRRTGANLLDAKRTIELIASTLKKDSH